MSKGIVEAVQAGEQVPITYRGSEDRTETVTVKVACPNQTGGHWYCVTHQEGFAHNFDKDTHIREGKHRLVWICHEHGAEQP
jgi:hypothetical protein